MHLHSEPNLSSLQLTLFRVAAVKHLPIHHHSVDYIFLVLLDHWAHSESVKNIVALEHLAGARAWAVLHHYITAHEVTQ